MKSKILKLAQRQLADYDNHRPGGMFRNNAVMLKTREAYDLQIQIAQLRIRRGEALAGYKVGCTTAAIRTQLGLDEPVWGHVFASEMRTSGSILDPSQFECLAVEGEFAFRLREEIPTSAWLRENRQRAIASGFPVIELHNYVFRRRTPTAEELIANNALHAGVVLPLEETSACDPCELVNEEISICKNGKILGTAAGSEVSGGPLESLVWLADRLGDFGFQLKQDQVILTGSPLPLLTVHVGDRIAVQCKRLGFVECVINKCGSIPTEVPK
ncbi:MAG: hypothetical protein L0387_09560 [Acidobacteria bacterium]|nr:hypothetical protein [Nitrospiraceae bacterium]MCI0621901.1 hypothetical protein [Acidobacteriota bacterium]MCI0717435.1 hypothetical protein [Acidobacteriota bacterium]